MAEVKWIKITTTMFDDEKIKLIEKMPEGTSILLIWIKLLTLAGKCNATGQIFLSEDIAYTDEMLSVIFNMPLSTVRLALNTFNQFGMIDISESHIIKIVNWEKHQNIQGLDKIREDTRKRVQAYRERQKLIGECNVTVTESNEIEEEEKKNKKKNKKNIYAEFVSMSEEEHQKLINTYGEWKTNLMITILDNYKGSKGKTYKSDYRAILSWVVDKVEKEVANGTYKQPNGQSKPNPGYDKSKWLATDD